MGNDTVLLGNTLQFRSGDLDIPYAMDATHIKHNSFYANWDDVAGAMSYKLSVFRLTKSGMATEIEGFDDVLSVGRPLPEGWSSNAYGTFQDSLRVGASAPAMKLSEANDYLQSKNYPAPVESMSFMYCFPDNVWECRMVVEAGYSDKFEPIDTIYSMSTNKNTKSYTFHESKGYRSFRWIFTDNNGNATLSLDDVEVT